jgi:hypothetical protein
MIPLSFLVEPSTVWHCFATVFGNPGSFLVFLQPLKLENRSAGALPEVEGLSVVLDHAAGGMPRDGLDLVHRAPGSSARLP